ncbi:hypothetical protein G7046_g7859 [Stylonectria norvegica]|nr:hypothetical protein G7046_g7859 [Stylonectria norvegica]
MAEHPRLTTTTTATTDTPVKKRPYDLLDAVRSSHKGRHGLIARKAGRKQRREARAKEDRREERREASYAYHTGKQVVDPDVAEAQWEAREIKRLARIRNKHAFPRRKRLREMTAPELQQRIEYIIQHEDEKRGLHRGKDEDEEYYEYRMEWLEGRVNRVNREQWRRDRKTKLRYVEGTPVNVQRQMVSVWPLEPVMSFVMTPCLQCLAKKMRCSHESMRGNPLDSGACARCARHGETCLIKYPDHPDAAAYYIYAEDDMGDEAEERALAKSLMAMREVKTVPPLPRWHENDDPENRRDLDYEDKEWRDVLVGAEVSAENRRVQKIKEAAAAAASSPYYSSSSLDMERHISVSSSRSSSTSSSSGT